MCPMSAEHCQATTVLAVRGRLGYYDIIVQYLLATVAGVTDTRAASQAFEHSAGCHMHSRAH